MNFKKYLEVSLDKAKIQLENGFYLKEPNYVKEKIEEIEKIQFCIDVLEDWKTYWADEDQTCYAKEDLEVGDEN